MKLIILEQTVLLKCKTDEDFDKLLKEGYVVKETKNKFKYLVKDEVL